MENDTNQETHMDNQQVWELLQAEAQSIKEAFARAEDACEQLFQRLLGERLKAGMRCLEAEHGVRLVRTPWREGNKLTRGNDGNMYIVAEGYDGDTPEADGVRVTRYYSSWWPLDMTEIEVLGATGIAYRMEEQLAVTLHDMLGTAVSEIKERNPAVAEIHIIYPSLYVKTEAFEMLLMTYALVAEVG